MVDIKSIFEVLSCISFKGTQYKEFRLIREMFNNIGTDYTPKSLKVPINYSFSLHFDIKTKQQAANAPLDLKA